MIQPKQVEESTNPHDPVKVTSCEFGIFDIDLTQHFSKEHAFVPLLELMKVHVLKDHTKRILGLEYNVQ